MRFFALFSVIFVGFCLSGCASHPTDYLKKGGEISPLVVPKDAPMLKQQTYYPVPNTPVKSSRKPVSLMPPTLQNK